MTEVSLPWVSALRSDPAAARTAGGWRRAGLRAGRPLEGAVAPRILPG